MEKLLGGLLGRVEVELAFEIAAREPSSAWRDCFNARSSRRASWTAVKVARRGSSRRFPERKAKYNKRTSIESSPSMMNSQATTGITPVLRSHGASAVSRKNSRRAEYSSLSAATTTPVATSSSCSAALRMLTKCTACDGTSMYWSGLLV